MNRIETPEQLEEFFESGARQINIGEYWDALGMSDDALQCVSHSIVMGVAEGMPLPAAIQMALTLGAQLALRLAP